MISPIELSSESAESLTGQSLYIDFQMLDTDDGPVEHDPDQGTVVVKFWAT